tara:strand:- start:309 stop:974 length:666 start_codon:yes stop_codon:yes gene_type:complete
VSGHVISGVKNARLPGVYIEAKKALVECQRIDECKEWADKAAAIASYAKQAQDQTLMDTATRIKARAIRRCGELLKQIEGAKGGVTKKGTRGSAPSPVSRASAATAAGLSERQRKDALRVASLDASEFDAAVESENPPTVTELSEAGRRAVKNREYLEKPKPKGFRDATKLLGESRRFAEFCERADPAIVADALTKRESKRVMGDIETISAWLTKFKKEVM